MPKLTKILSLVLLYIVFYLGFSFLMSKLSISKVNLVEKYMMNTGLQVVTAGYNQQIKSLELLARDWSYWDDPYNFMTGANKDFPANELQDETLQNQDLNMILFYNTAGTLFYKKTYSEEGKDIPLPTQLLGEEGGNSLKPDILKVFEESEIKGGLIHTLNGNLMYAIAPILSSDGSGSAHGVLLMGKYLDDEDVQLIRNGVGLELDVRDCFNLSQDMQKKFEKGDTFFERQDENLVAYKLIRDVFGIPSFYLEFYFPKIVYNSMQEIIWTFSTVCAFFCTLPFILLFRPCKPKKQVDESITF